MNKSTISQKIVSFYADRYQEMAGYKKPLAAPPLPEMLECLSQLPDAVFYRYAFLREPLRERIDSVQREELFLRCVKDGEQYARKLIEQFGVCKPTEIARQLGIKIERPFRPSGGGRVLFAEFEEPDTIRVYQSAVSNAQKAIKSYHLEDMFEKVQIEEVLVAHELFHYVEMAEKNTVFSLNYKICLWKLGSYQHMSRLTTISEISAMAFAKYLTKLSFSPYLFDVFLSYTYDTDIGGSLFHEIRQLAENYPI